MINEISKYIRFYYKKSILSNEDSLMITVTHFSLVNTILTLLIKMILVVTLTSGLGLLISSPNQNSEHET